MKKDVGSEHGLRKAGEARYNAPLMMKRLLGRMERARDPDKLGSVYDQATFMLSLAHKWRREGKLSDGDVRATTKTYRKIVKLWEKKTGKKSQSKYK